MSYSMSFRSTEAGLLHRINFGFDQGGGLFFLLGDGLLVGKIGLDGI
jgi:hypothetical protein